MNDLLERVERIRYSGKNSGEYWKVRWRERDLYVYLVGGGDLVRLRKHYPGANGSPVTKDEWMLGVA